MVRVDRVSGKRVLDGMPGDDPKAAIIWEAFKAESEARTGPSNEELGKQRDALINAIRRGASRSSGAQSAPAAGADSAPSAAPTVPVAPAVGVQ